jgi:hypothetical protein
LTLARRLALSWSEVSDWFAASISASVPETIGADIDVPLMKL